MSESSRKSSQPEVAQGLAREFVPVENPKEALLLIKEASAAGASSILWTRNQEQTVESFVSVLSMTEHVFHIWRTNELSPEEFETKLQESGQADCYFSVSLSRCNIFFKSRYLGCDSGGLRFQIPERVYKIQRRKHPRFPIPDGYVLYVEYTAASHPDQAQKAKVLDISAGGLSFHLKPGDERPYFRGMELKDIIFQVRGRKVMVDGIIRHIREIPSTRRNSGLKIGVEFTEISPENKRWLASCIEDESRRYLTKLL